MDPREQTKLFLEVFVYQKTDSVNLDALAARCGGRSYQTAYEWVNDSRRHKPPWLWRAAVEVSGDHRFREELEPRGWHLVIDPGSVRPATNDLLRECTDPMLESGRLVELARKFMEDGVIDRVEDVKLRMALAKGLEQFLEVGALLDEVQAVGGKVTALSQRKP